MASGQNKASTNTVPGRRELLGRLIRSYREDSSHAGGMLTEDALLHLMSVHGSIKNEHLILYRDQYDNSDVTSWENGQSQVPNEFIKDFGEALNIPEGEVEQMLSLAGEDTGSESSDSDRNTVVGILQKSAHNLVPPGGYMSIVGFALGALGLDGTESLMSYVIGLLAIVIGMWVWQWRRKGFDADEVTNDMFFVSIFFLSNSALLLSAVTRIDPYGIHSLPFVKTGPFQFMFVMMINLFVSLIAWAMFAFLRERLSRTNVRKRTNAYLRAIVTVFPPIFFAYIFGVALTSDPGGWIASLVTLGITFGAFTVITAFKDKDVKLSEWEAKWGPIVAIELILILCIVGVVGMLVAYLDPAFIGYSGVQHNLLWSWELDFDALGYPESEFLDRFRLGVLWSAIATIAFMSTVMGTYLVVTIRRAGEEEPVAELPLMSEGLVVTIRRADKETSDDGLPPLKTQPSTVVLSTEFSHRNRRAGRYY